MSVFGQDLIDEFAFLDDWEERYGHVIDLGKSMPAMAQAERSEANRVTGCVSQVWLSVAKSPAGCLTVQADSDAAIVKGLAAIVVRLSDGQMPSTIAGSDYLGVFDAIGLGQHLSGQRANGLRSLIDTLKARAALLA